MNLPRSVFVSVQRRGSPEVLSGRQPERSSTRSSGTVLFGVLSSQRSQTYELEVSLSAFPPLAWRVWPTDVWPDIVGAWVTRTVWAWTGEASVSASTTPTTPVAPYRPIALNSDEATARLLRPCTRAAHMVR